MKSSRLPTILRRLFRPVWLALFVIFVFFLIYPINAGLIRGFLTICFPMLVGGFLFLIWNHKTLRITSLVITGSFTIFLLTPGRTVDPIRLQDRYVDSLGSFESVRYVWGGENRFGIDCSGLVRKAMIVACVREGLTTMNPRLIRNAVEFWWYDCSARALKTGFRNWTQLQFASTSIREIPLDKLTAGDIAVTSDGIHVLAHLGDGEWIEADPGAGKVLRIKPQESNSWVTVPVHILRWEILRTGDTQEYSSFAK